MSPLSDQSVSGRAETAIAPFRHWQLINLDEPTLLNPLDNQLGDPLTTQNLEGLNWVGVNQKDLEFTPVARINQAGCVQTRDAVL